MGFWGAGAAPAVGAAATDMPRARAPVPIAEMMGEARMCPVSKWGMSGGFAGRAREGTACVRGGRCPLPKFTDTFGKRSPTIGRHFEQEKTCFPMGYSVPVSMLRNVNNFPLRSVIGDLITSLF
ncbi:hypothetical protein GCM10007147_12510 [Nocardiopsis kunsanensis]|uniref:Uncharacterized protein n=1 Tax=Nocardiopsis kunsanensis TaxID=141693 RepID=A0A919CGC9_9ACTN|nr:hypothetical protein GCM10007147_12510 [Nocardiopsis kunsanensis]